ncbi:MAG TPA: cation-translocating P-type ATPase [Phycisphaerales bacterium]|nr:cation-translocating P-type ATPase [Phycisphaerales bacterium]
MQPVRASEVHPPVTWAFPRAVFTARFELRASIVAGVLLALGYVLHVWLKLGWAEGFIWASLAIGMVYGGRAAWASLREKKFDIDVLMIVGAGLAAYIGHPEEGALLLFLFVLAGALEDLAMERTKREVEALHKLMPTEALVLRDGEWVEAPAESLVIGESLRVRPGERVPADAVVVEGQSTIDQSAITGESMPRAVKAGDELYAGTINTDDPLVARVLRPVKESSLQKILDLVTQAREQREPVQRTIDRLSEPYAMGVMAVSVVVFVVWWLGLAREWTDAAYTAITLLIVASPCALVIATPTATLAAIARAAREGVLFKGGQSIDRLAGLAAVAFDKTGTLTFGRPRLYEVHPVAWSDGRELLAIAASLEADSTHPIAAAVREAAMERGVGTVEMTDVNHVTARGIEGRQADGGALVRLGSYAFTEEVIPVCLRNRVKEVLTKIQHRGHVAVVVARAGTGAGTEEDPGGDAAVLIMADQVRPGAAGLVRELHALGIKPVVMLTGDNRLTAGRIAESLGLDGFEAELLPQDKLEAVRKLKTGASGGVGVIGDGVNDAPALAAADVSVGIGTIGTAAALESSDIVLLSDNLAAVPWAVGLARKARSTVKRNLVFAVSVIVLMAAATLVGSLTGRVVPLSVGVLAHEGGTLLVVLNSLLLLWGKGITTDPGEKSTPITAICGKTKVSTVTS